MSNRSLVSRLLLASELLEADVPAKKSKQTVLPGTHGQVPAEVVDKFGLTQAAWDRMLTKVKSGGGQPVRIGESSGRGFVFDIGNNRVLKLTGDPVEATSGKVLKEKPMKEAYTVYSVYEFEDHPGIFALVLEKLYPAKKEYVDMVEKWEHRKVPFFLPLVPEEVQDLFMYEAEYAPGGAHAALGEWLMRAAEGLFSRGIEYTDFHRGNIMRRSNGEHVIIDIGGMSVSPSRRITKAQMMVRIADELLSVAKVLSTLN